MGLMLKYKKYKDRYFDSDTYLEFQKSEINKHFRWFKNEYDDNGYVICKQYSNNTWQRWEHTNRLLTYYERSDGYWSKHEYNESGNKIRMEDSDGFKAEWYKIENDQNGNHIYYETCSNYWKKTEYDANGNRVYYENSDGVIIDKRK